MDGTGQVRKTLDLADHHTQRSLLNSPAAYCLLLSPFASHQAFLLILIECNLLFTKAPLCNTDWKMDKGLRAGYNSNSEGLSP